MRKFLHEAYPYIIGIFITYACMHFAIRRAYANGYIAALDYQIAELQIELDKVEADSEIPANSVCVK